MVPPRKILKLDECPSEFQFPDEEEDALWEIMASQSVDAASIASQLPPQPPDVRATPTGLVRSQFGNQDAGPSSSVCDNSIQTTFSAARRAQENERRKRELEQLHEKSAEQEDIVQSLLETVAKKDFEIQDLKRDYEGVLKQVQMAVKDKEESIKEIEKLRTQLSFTSKELSTRKWPHPSGRSTQSTQSTHHQVDQIPSTSTRRSGEERGRAFPGANNFAHVGPEVSDVVNVNSAVGDADDGWSSLPIGTPRGQQSGARLMTSILADVVSCSESLSQITVSSDWRGHRSPLDPNSPLACFCDSRRSGSATLNQLVHHAKELQSDLDLAIARLMDDAEPGTSTQPIQLIELRNDSAISFLRPLTRLLALGEAVCARTAADSRSCSGSHSSSSSSSGTTPISGATTYSTSSTTTTFHHHVSQSCPCSRFTVGALGILERLLGCSARVRARVLTTDTELEEPPTTLLLPVKGNPWSPTLVPPSYVYTSESEESPPAPAGPSRGCPILTTLFRLTNAWVNSGPRINSHAESIRAAMAVLNAVARYSPANRFSFLLSPGSLSPYLSPALGPSTVLMVIDLLGHLCRSPDFVQASCKRDFLGSPCIVAPQARPAPVACLFLHVCGLWMTSKIPGFSLAERCKLDRKIIQLLVNCIAVVASTKIPFLTSRKCRCPTEVSWSLVTYLHRVIVQDDETGAVDNVQNLYHATALLHQLVMLDQNFSEHTAPIKDSLLEFIYWLPTESAKKYHLGRPAVGGMLEAKTNLVTKTYTISRGEIIHFTWIYFQEFQ